ncbi:MAG: hypothetical protein RMK29_02020 [Myxococcales bacterium]|nr:hypothetical protein [Myxococcales bacterium]
MECLLWQAQLPSDDRVSTRMASSRAMGRQAAFRRRHKAVRVTVLLLVLGAVLAWSGRMELRRRARAHWNHTLPVEVVLLRHGSVPPQTVHLLIEGFPRLERMLARELARYRPGAPPPFSFRAHGPVPIDELPPEPPASLRLWHRAAHYVRLERYLARVHERGRLQLRSGVLRLYVITEPPHNRLRFVEGFGGGEIGVVRAALDDTNLDQALLAMAHELLHCLGAMDKYDDAGHAIVPDGLAEPDRVPLYPQRYAEVMVGEVPMKPDEGRLVETLAEVRVGPTTAQEIGWLQRGRLSAAQYSRGPLHSGGPWSALNR